MALGNTTIRILVSVVAIPLILAAAYFGSIYFYIFVLALGLIAFYEFSVMAKSKSVTPNIYLGILSVALIITNQFKPAIGLFSLVIVLLFLLTLFELFRNKSSAILNVSVTIFGVLYIGLFSSALIGLREFYPNINDLYQRGGYIIISILATIWICDSAAFFIGTAFGKHKLFPRISPNKSWEGALAGFVFAIITMIAAKFIVLDFLSLSSAIIIGIIIGLFGQIGDLVESLFKRDAGVKDSSALIPGHGGVFDRFDSLLYTAPLIWLYLRYFN